ncbi:unnamed protein product [Calypogeia fissa]
MTSSWTVVSAFTLLLVISSACLTVESLTTGFYTLTCPKAAAAVSSVVTAAVRKDSRVAAALIRLLFHDCFVRGCDASILITSNPGKNEIDDVPNQTLHDLNVIDNAKTAAEAVCKKTVSCADIIAFAAAISLELLGGPKVDTRSGRLDGFVSNIGEPLSLLPSPFDNLGTLQSKFNKVGLSPSELVVLSGAHTVGKAHCSSFSGRLRNFSPQNQTDPSLDPKYAASLQKECPSIVSPSVIVSMDPISNRTFDNAYYTDVEAHKGLFSSDAALLNSGVSSRAVAGFAS